MIKAVLFDLDGTLLPMNQEAFVKEYVDLLAKKSIENNLDPIKLNKTIWDSIRECVYNQTNLTNEEIFGATFKKAFGESILKYEQIFNDFHKNEFKELKKWCGCTVDAKEVINIVKEKDKMIVLATNPVFPRIATETRMEWAGLNKDDFSLYTTYENSYHCKPNIEYYKDILKIIDCQPEECLMIGNDVEEDMIASSIGINTYLLTDYLINKYNKDISIYNHGNFTDLIKYLNTL